jgi:hypothetical protein
MSRPKLPPPKPHPPQASLIDAFNEELQRDFQLAPLGRYTLVVEGITDVQYLQLAAQKAEERSGVRLLDIPVADDAGSVSTRASRDMWRARSSGSIGTARRNIFCQNLLPEVPLGMT